MAAFHGLDPKLYSGQSLRKGGGTTLCSGGKIQGYAIKKHARWRSDIYVDTYQHLTTDTRREVSAKLSAFPSNGKSKSTRRYTTRKSEKPTVWPNFISEPSAKAGLNFTKTRQ